MQAWEGWDSACLETGCWAAASGFDGKCLAHLSEEALEELSYSGMPMNLDGRGAHFDKGSLNRLLDAIFSESEGRCLGTVRFEGATFDSLVDFDNTLFIGPVSFANSTFLGDARFGGTVFSAGTFFDGASFKGQAWFVESVFRLPVSFCGAAFSKPAWFQRAEFRGSTSLDDTTFSENVSFLSTQFLSASSFARASFHSHALFDTSALTVAIAWEGVSFSHKDEAPSAVPPAPTSLASAGVIDGLAPSPPPRSRARPRRLHASSLIPLLILAVVALTYFVVLRPEGGAVVESASPEIPRGRPDAFAFSSVDALGRPARFNSCQPIRYVVNTANAPSHWMELLAASLRELNSASGLTFEDAGLTNETVRPPGADGPVRPAFQPDRYPADKWAPVLVTWEKKDYFSSLGPTADGFAEAQDLPNADGAMVRVTGTVAISSSTPTTPRVLLMHEFAHLLGLGHVDDKEQLMYSTSTRVQFGAGDLAGLSKLGREAECLKTPSPL